MNKTAQLNCYSVACHSRGSGNPVVKVYFDQPAPPLKNASRLRGNDKPFIKLRSLKTFFSTQTIAEYKYVMQVYILMVLINAMAMSTSHAAATITIVNADGPGEGFNSTTFRSPEGGNNGTTLGQQRLNLFQAAANIWAAKLNSPIAIKVESRFDALTCTSNGAVLGAAGPTEIFSDFSAAGGNPAPKPATWYAVAEAEAIAQTNFNSTDPEIQATFNSAIDTNCFGGGTFWYGTSSSIAVPNNRIALLPVVLHEIGHGLGFLSLVDETTGALFSGQLDIWSHFLRSRSNNLLWKDMNNTQRIASAIGDPNLIWDGANVTAAIPAFISGSAGLNGSGSSARLRMYAPSPVDPGSSVSHFTVDASPNLLMEPDFNDDLFNLTDITDTLLKDIGWPISVAAGNQAPTSTVPTAFSFTEDTIGNLSGISFADVDAGSNNVLVSFSIPASSGTLSDVGCGGVVFNPANSTLRTLTGSIANINTCIGFGNIRFLPASDSTASVVLTVTINDQGNSGAGGARITTKTANLNINAVNDAPSISATPGQSVIEDSVSNTLTGITFNDVDAANSNITLTTTITSGGGTLSWNPVCSGTGPSGSQTALVVTGSVTNVRNCLINNGALKYSPVNNANGNVSFNILISDNGNTGSGGVKTASTTHTISIAAVNDAPTITAASNININEDSNNTSINGITVADIDASSSNVLLTFSIPSGSLNWNPVCASTSPGGTPLALTVSGPVASIQSCLNGGSLKFTPVANQTQAVVLTSSINDNGNTGSGGARSASTNSNLNIVANNDAPTISAPTAFATDEDVVLIFSGLSINDIDADASNITLTTSANSGSLSWNPVCAGTSPGGTASNLTVTGSLAAIQACINTSIRFTPAQNNITDVAIGFTINDNGNTGSGGALSATSNAIVNITAQNDAPQISAPNTLNANIELPSAISGVILQDVDAAQGTGSWTLNVSTQNGNGLFHFERDGALAPSCNSTDVLLPNGNDQATIEITGTLVAINACLSQNALTWIPPLNPNPNETVVLNLNDNGNFGEGNAQNTEDQIILNIVNLFGDGFE